MKNQDDGMPNGNIGGMQPLHIAIAILVVLGVFWGIKFFF